MEQISIWWNSLEVFEKIFWGIAIPFSVVFIIQLIMTFVGIDHDHSGDLHAEMEDTSGIENDSTPFGFFTVKNFIVFFTIFGWTGITCIQNGLGKTLTIVLATILGVLMMFVVASIFYFMNKMTHSGTLNTKNAIGQTGDVYIPIPPKRMGAGKIQIKVQGSLREMEAMTDLNETLKTGTLVKVVEVLDNNILIVTK